jgi:hypothetical protein
MEYLHVTLGSESQHLLELRGELIAVGKMESMYAE